MRRPEDLNLGCALALLGELQSQSASTMKGSQIWMLVRRMETGMSCMANAARMNTLGVQHWLRFPHT